jgi:hypothetical protein
MHVKLANSTSIATKRPRMVGLTAKLAFLVDPLSLDLNKLAYRDTLSLDTHHLTTTTTTFEYHYLILQLFYHRVFLYQLRFQLMDPRLGLSIFLLVLLLHLTQYPPPPLLPKKYHALSKLYENSLIIFKKWYRL